MKSSTSRSHYSFAPEQLYYTLTSRYDPEMHIESTIVKSVWYGKQTKGVQHEFILIAVEDTKALLKNYIVLDRNIAEESTSPASGVPNLFRQRKRTTSSSQSYRGPAMDAFKVAYNGDEKQLLQECQLLPRQYLEMLEFSSPNPLYLYQLVTLVHLISERDPQYALHHRNCYWFAGLIWECLLTLRPDAKYDGRQSEKRGKIATLRYTPDDCDKNEICNAFKEKIETVEKDLAASRRGCYQLGFAVVGTSDRIPGPVRDGSNGSRHGSLPVTRPNPEEASLIGTTREAMAPATDSQSSGTMEEWGS